MERVPCQAQPEHTAVWRCSCALPFCTDCVLLHVQSPGQHTLSLLGSIHLCVLCQGQSSDPVRVCQRCIQRLSAAGEVLLPEIIGRPSANILAEVAAKEAAEEGPREANIRAEQPAGGLQEVFLQRKNDFHQSIMRAMENMNGLEDTFYRALGQETELRVCQTQLVHAQEEVLRLRALPPPQVQAAPANEALVEALKTQLEQLNIRLLDQGALQTQIQELSTQVSQLKYELQKSVQDQVEEQVKQNTLDLRERLQEAARTAVSKVSDVMPLVAHLDGDWMDREGAESFLRLASLGINDDLQSACMRQVARVCSLLARASGPCPHLAAFANQVNTRLKRNSEMALQFVNQLEEVYLIFKELPTAKGTLQRLLRLADSEALDDMVTMLLRFSRHLDVTSLTYFADAIMDFIAQDTPTRDDWRLALLGFPIEWTSGFAEEMGKVLRAVVERKFDATSLRLVQFLQVYRPTDPSPLLSFVTRTVHLITNPQTIASVDALLQGVAEQVSAALKLPSAQSKQACDRVILALRLVKTTSTAAELNQAAQLMTLLKPNQALFKAACALVDCFSGFKDEAKMTSMGLGALEWMFPGGRQRAEAAFCEWLLERVNGSESNAERAGLLLAELSRMGSQGELEQALPRMSTKLPIEKAVELTLLLASSAKALGPQFSTVIASSLTLVETVVNPVELADKVSALLRNNRTEALVRCFSSFAALNKRRSGDAVGFVCETLAVLSVGDDTVLFQLLQDLIKVLNIDNLPQDLVLRVPILWLRARHRLPDDTRMADFCIYVLKQLRQPDLPGLLGETERVLAEEGASYLTAMKLTEIYRKHALPGSMLSQWLISLRSLRGADALAALFHRIDSVPQASAKLVTGFIEVVLLLCTAKPAEVGEISGTLGALLDKAEALQLLTNLTALSNVELMGSLLTTVRLQQDKSVLVSCTELSALLVYFERDRLPPPDLRPTIQRRSEDLTKLVQVCVPMVQNPAHHMTTLASLLLAELGNRPNADILLLIPTMAVDMVGAVGPDRVQELGQELIVASRDVAGEERVRKLLGNFGQIRGKLEEILRAGGRISLQALDPPLPQPSQARELVHVTASYLRFFNFQNAIWGPQVNLRTTIQASNYSRWVILEDGYVFCCGGEGYTGYDSSRRYNASSSTSYLAAGTYKEVYMLARDGSVDRKADMNVARAYHGVLEMHSKNAVYVFGGRMF